MNAHMPIAKPSHYDRDIEGMVAAHVLARQGALSDVLAHCQVDDFTSDVFARIVECAQVLQEDGLSVSPLAIRGRLSGDIARIVEAETGLQLLDFLEGLAKSASPLQKIAELAKSVSDLALRRRVDAELDAARQRLCAYDTPAIKCLEGVLEVTGEVMDRTAKTKGHQSLSEAATDMMRKLEDAANGIALPSILTGLTRLDNVTGGFQGGDLIIIAGRPGMGKTIALSTVCRAAAQAGKPAIMVELEMPRLQLLQRLACDLDYDRKLPHQRSIAYTRLRAGKLAEGEFDRVYAATQAMAPMPLQIYDTAGQTIHEISALCERQVSRAKTMGVICIDYLQIIRPSNRYAGSKVNEVTEISNACKVLAKRTGWPVVLGSQLNRQIEARTEKRPTLSDLRESGAIEQDADMVIGLHRPAYYVEAKRPANGRFDPSWNAWAADWRLVQHDLEVCVLKNRNGPPSVFNVHIDIQAGAIRNGQGPSTTIAEDFYPEGYAG